MQVSSAISFRLPPASISAAASSGSPLLSGLCFLASLGPSFHEFYSASCRLSDLRCFRILSSASVLDSDYSASAFPFLLFPVPPRRCFPGALFPLSLPQLSSLSPAWFPMRSFPIPVLGFAVRFLSPFPDSLPQPFLRCLHPAYAFCIFRFPSAFFRPLPFHFRLLSLLRFLFPSSRLPLAVVLPVPIYPLPFRLVSHASLPALVLSLAAIPFTDHASPHSSYLRVSAFFLSVSGLFPLVITLGSGYSAWECTLKTEHRSLIFAITQDIH